MANREMSERQKRAMHWGRVKSRKEKEAAAQALSNPQFQNPKFWRDVEPDVLVAVRKAIGKAERDLRKERASLLEPELAEEVERLASLQAEATASKARVRALRTELNKLA